MIAYIPSQYRGADCARCCFSLGLHFSSVSNGECTYETVSNCRSVVRFRPMSWDGERPNGDNSEKREKSRQGNPQKDKKRTDSIHEKANPVVGKRTERPTIQTLSEQNLQKTKVNGTKMVCERREDAD